VERTTIWASAWRKGFEDWLSMEDRPSKTHPEVIAIKHMTEDEEMAYIYENYIKEPEDEPDSQVDSEPSSS
jgi:hypothetical protein